jgi:ComF family protein
MIYALKFKRQQELARLFGELLAASLTATPLPDCLVPVPLHPSRYRTRGFNQALEIARPLADRLKLPLCPNLCRRVRPTPPQRLLDAQTRRQNLRGAFQATADLSGCRIALVDDVLTTGATADALAAVLKQAGAKQVEVWVLARA